MSPATGEDLARLIESFRFTHARFDAGYVEEDVDDLLGRLAAAARAGDRLGSIIAGARLRTAEFRKGYTVSEVDSGLEQIAVSAGSEVSAPRQEGAEQPVRDARFNQVSAGDAEPVLPNVIIEQRGLLARLFGRRSR